jgi:hypothetical protein
MIFLVQMKLNLSTAHERTTCDSSASHGTEHWSVRSIHHGLLETTTHQAAAKGA